MKTYISMIKQEETKYLWANYEQKKNGRKTSKFKRILIVCFAFQT